MKRLLYLFVIALVVAAPTYASRENGGPLNQDTGGSGGQGVECWSPQCATMIFNEKTQTSGCGYDYTNGGCACLQGSPAGTCHSTGR